MVGRYWLGQNLAPPLAAGAGGGPAGPVGRVTLSRRPLLRPEADALHQSDSASSIPAIEVPS